MIEYPWRKSSFSNGSSACVEARRTLDGCVQVRDSKDPAGPVLTFTPVEWDAFLCGVHAGDFNLDEL